MNLTPAQRREVAKHWDLYANEFDVSDDEKERSPKAAKVAKKKKPAHRFAVQPPVVTGYEIRQPWFEPLLWGHPSTVMVVGRTGSGKSSIISHYLSSPEFFGRKDPRTKKLYFDRVYLFSESKDPTLTQTIPQLKGWERRVGKEDQNVFHDLDAAPQIIEKLLNGFEQDVKNHGRNWKKNLFIFDDCVSHRKFWSSKALRRCYFNNRHHSLSTITATQQLHSIHLSYRIQSTHVLLLRGGSPREIEAMYSSFAQDYFKNKKEYQAFIESVLQGKYEFLLINRKCHPSIANRNSRLNIVLPSQVHQATAEREIRDLEKRIRDSLK